MAGRLNQKQINEKLLGSWAEAANNPYKEGAAMRQQVIKGSQELDTQNLADQNRLAQFLQGKQVDQEQAIAQETRNHDMAMGIRKLLGKDASVRVGDVQFDPRNYEQARFQQGLADKEADNERLETAAIQGEYNKLSGKSREQLQALKEIEDLIQDPSSVSEGQLRTALARAAGDVGALSEGDVNRTLPRTLGADLKGAWNYVTGGTESRLSKEQVKAVQDLIIAKRAAVNGRMAGAGTEVQTRAKTLAPTLTRKGKLNTVMQGLGVGSTQGQEDPAQQVLRRIQELEAKKAGK